MSRALVTGLYLNVAGLDVVDLDRHQLLQNAVNLRRDIPNRIAGQLSIY